MGKSAMKQLDEIKKKIDDVKEISKRLGWDKQNCVSCASASKEDDGLKILLALGGVIGVGFLLFKARELKQVK